MSKNLPQNLIEVEKSQEYQRSSINSNDTSILEPNEHRLNERNKIYITLNKLLHSKKCFYYYIFLLIFSIILFIYSIIAVIYKLDEKIILIFEFLIVMTILVDIIMKCISEGVQMFFTKFLTQTCLFIFFYECLYISFCLMM